MPPTIHHNLLRHTTTHHHPKYIHHHLPPAKICPPPSPTIHRQPNISTTTHHDPPPPTTCQNMSITTHHDPPTFAKNSLPAKIYLPPPTTSQNISTLIYQFLKNGPPPCKKPKYIHILPPLDITLTVFFLRNALFLSVMEILCNKVLISLFFKFYFTIFKSF